MYYVYVIQSKNQKLYFGFTTDVAKRLEHHNQGKNASTKFGIPWRYVYLEGYRSEKDARAREKKLKQYGNSRTRIKQRIQHSLGE